MEIFRHGLASRYGEFMFNFMRLTNCSPESTIIYSQNNVKSLVAQWVKNSPAMQETQEMQVQSLGQEDPLEKGRATHSSILAWRVPGTENPGKLQSMGSQRV